MMIFSPSTEKMSLDSGLFVQPVLWSVTAKKSSACSSSLGKTAET